MRDWRSCAELPGPAGKAGQKIEADLAAGNVDQAFRDAAKTVGAVLLVLGLIAAVTLHLIGQHKGRSASWPTNWPRKTPVTPTLQTIAQKLDSVEDKIAAKLPGDAGHRAARGRAAPLPCSRWSPRRRRRPRQRSSEHISPIGPMSPMGLMGPRMGTYNTAPRKHFPPCKFATA